MFYYILMGLYNKQIHKQVLIRIDTKKRMDELKKHYNLSSYNAVINHLIDTWNLIQTKPEQLSH